MKQTLEEAAYDYATNKTKFRKEVLKEVDPDNYVSRKSDCMEDFQSGAEWQAKQSPWISVEDRFPEGNTGVFFTVEWNDIYKVGYFVGLYYEDGQWESERRIFLPNSSLVRVTHWMPIPSFDEILEANRDVLERIKEKGD